VHAQSYVILNKEEKRKKKKGDPEKNDNQVREMWAGN
jgi:hypothetical protein